MTIEHYRAWQSTKIDAELYLSVVIPTYNEELRIVPTIGAVAAFISSLGFAWELIISDDGSTDSTVELVESLDLANLTLLSESPNTGKGGAVRRGAERSTGSLLLFLDADQSTPIEQLPAFIDATENGAGVVIGSRNLAGSEVSNKSLLRRVLSHGLQTIVRRGMRLRYRDTQCGFKLFEGEAGRALFSASQIDGFSFDLELLYIADRSGIDVAELPVRWHDAPGSTVSGGRAAVQFILDMPKIFLNQARGRYRLGPLPSKPKAERKATEQLAASSL